MQRNADAFKLFGVLAEVRVWLPVGSGRAAHGAPFGQPRGPTHGVYRVLRGPGAVWQFATLIAREVRDPRRAQRACAGVCA